MYLNSNLNTFNLKIFVFIAFKSFIIKLHVIWYVSSNIRMFRQDGPQNRIHVGIFELLRHLHGIRAHVVNHKCHNWRDITA